MSTDSRRRRAGTSTWARVLPAATATFIAVVPSASAAPWDPSVISEVAERVTPAVVSLTTQLSEPDAEPGRGTGSGVILTRDGLIVTSHHVVAGAEPIWATLADGRRFRATLVGSDASTDVAVVRVEASELPTVTLGDARGLRLGALVLAVGNPFDVGQTVTLGIVSALGRSSVGILDYEDFIQTDAAINPGNSGGALVNLRGELVGINTSIISRTGAAQGVGFAIPTHVVTWVRDQLLSDGQVRHGWLGVRAQALEPEVAEQLDIPLWAGVLITDLVGEPARRAGLRVDDVITHVDGRLVSDADQLRSRIGLRSPGSRVRLQLLRDGERREVRVTLGESGWVEPKERRSRSEPEPQAGAPGDPSSGAALAPLTEGFRRRWSIPETVDGWVVTGIDAGTPAASSRLEVHDVVLEVDGDRLATPEALADALATKRHAVLRVHRRGSVLFVVLRR